MTSWKSHSIIWIPQFELVCYDLLGYGMWCLYLILSTNLKEYFRCYTCLKIIWRFFFFIFFSCTKVKKRDSISSKRPMSSSPVEKNGKHKASCCQQEWTYLAAGMQRNLSVSDRKFSLNKLLQKSSRAKTGRGKDTSTWYSIRHRAREQSTDSQRKKQLQDTDL